MLASVGAVAMVAARCASHAVVAAPVAITHVAVVDVRTGGVRDDQTVLIRDAHIAAVAPSDSVDLPRHSRVVDASGRYLIPGLWDAHIHLSYLGSCVLPVLIANGITAVRDAGARLDEIQAWRPQIARGDLVGPFIETAGPDLESGEWLAFAHQVAPPDHPIWHWGPRLEVDGPDDARRMVDSLARLGVDFVKFRNVPRATFLAIAAEARRHGLLLAGHAPHGTPLEEAADSGMASIEHAETITLALDTLPQRQRRHAFEELARKGTRVTPTLITEATLWLTPDSIQRAILADSNGVRDPYRKYVSSRALAVWRSTLALNAKGDDGSTDWQRLYRRQVADMRLAHAAGVHFLAGTDVGSIIGLYPGSSLHDELGLLVHDVGLTPLEALQSATIEPAAFFGLQRQRGAVSSGMVADLVLLDANPLADIENARRIRAVVANGRLYQRAQLDSILAEVANRAHEGAACGGRTGEETSPE